MIRATTGASGQQHGRGRGRAGVGVEVPAEAGAGGGVRGDPKELNHKQSEDLPEFQQQQDQQGHERSATARHL